MISSRRMVRVAFCIAMQLALIVGGVRAEAVTPVLQAHVDSENDAAIEASGMGMVPVRVDLMRLDNDPFPVGTTVRAVIERGDARFESGASSDLTTDELGAVTLHIMPGTQAGPLVIRFDVTELSTELELTLKVSTRKPIVVGYATGGIGPVPGWVDAPDGAPSGTNTRRGAISVYGTGEISKNTRGTFAYDSTDSLAQSLSSDSFIDNPNDRPYPTYGDASTRRDDALSTNRFFGSVQNGHSSAMWGEFHAQAAPSQAAGGYDVLVNGARLAVGGNVVTAGAFTARNNTAYARAVISPTGLAVASQALHPDIVIGSDVATLVHLDRRTGAIVSQSTLARGNDYVIDYASGLFRFLNVVLPYDEDFDPQIVVVQYEYGGPGAESTMLGAKSSVQLARSASVGSWYLNDSVGTGNLTLVGESIQGATKNTTWSVSHEASQGFLPITTTQYGNEGDSYRAVLTTQNQATRANLTFNSTTAGYDNPFGSYAAPGLTSLSAGVDVKVSRIATLGVSEQFTHNLLPASSASAAVGNTDESTAIALRVAPNARLHYHVGLRSDAAASNGVVNPVLFTAGGAQAPVTPGSFDSFLPPFGAASYAAGAGHALSADAGAAWRFTPHATLDVSRITALGSDTDPYAPPETRAELDLDVGQNGKAFLRQLWQDNASPALAASQAGQTFASTAQSETSVGFEQQAGRSTYQTGYAVDHTADGTDLFDAIGVRTKVIATSRLNADTFIQVGDSLYSTYAASGTSPFFTAFGTTLDYALPTFHASGRLQVRTGFDSGSTFELGATGPISPAVSLYSSYDGSFTENVFNTEARGGLAYRPSRNDRYVTLLSVDVYRTNLTNYNAYITNVAQIQELYRSSSRTEWAGSLAYKLTGDSFFAPRTSILGLRVDQRIGSRLDLGSEVHWSDVAPVSGTNATGFAVEAGYRLGSSVRLAGGFNFSGFADPATAINPTHRGLYVTLSSYVDRIFGWGKGQF